MSSLATRNERSSSGTERYWTKRHHEEASRTLPIEQDSAVQLFLQIGPTAGPPGVCIRLQ